MCFCFHAGGVYRFSSVAEVRFVSAFYLMFSLSVVADSDFSYPFPALGVFVKSGF